MKHSILSHLFGLLIIVFTIGCSASEKPNFLQEQMKIEIVRKQFFENETKKNFTGMRALTSSNMTVITSWGTIENMDSVENNLRAWNLKDHTIVSTVLKQQLSDDGKMAYELLQNEISASYPQGINTLTVYTTLVYKKEGAEWKIVHEAFVEKK